ncbi:MAG: proton-conducting transporter membrane subunit [Longimicrobiales bacterium]
MSLETLVLASLVVPLLGGVGIVLTGSRPNVREAVTLVTSGVLLAVIATLAPEVLQGERPEVTLVEMMPGLAIRFVVEPLGMIFALVAALLWPINSLYSIGYMRGNAEKHQTRFYLCFALAIGSVMGIAFAGNLVTLFVFYEVLTLSTYPLVTHKGSEDAMKAGRVYLGILMSTSIALLLVAVIWTVQVAGTSEFRPGGILEGRVSDGLAGVLLALYIFGIGKAAVMPVHRWLPAAMVAPTPVSALLHAVAVVKAGVFSVVKVVVYVFGVDFLAGVDAASWLVYAAGFTVLAGSVVALRILISGGNLKRMLAYSTVSQLSYVVLAAALFTPMAAAGAALHIVAHAFGKITLFFAAGSIYTAAHKTEIRQLHGIGRVMPWTMGAFAVGALSMIGLPPAGGFVSKWYMLLGAFEAQHLVAVAVIVASTLLNAAYFVPIVYMAFFKAPPAADDHGGAHAHGEAPWPIVVALVATASLTILLFFFPGVPSALARLMVGIG